MISKYKAKTRINIRVIGVMGDDVAVEEEEEEKKVLDEGEEEVNKESRMRNM